MKILFFGSTQGTHCSLHYFTAFSRLGHDVFAFDPQYFHTASFVEKVQLKLRRQPSPARIQAAARKLEDLTTRNKFDLVFVMAENYLSAETIRQVQKRSGGRTRFAYHSHDNVFSPGILKPNDFNEALKAYDFLFTTKSQNVKRYVALGQVNAFYIPSAYEPTCHRPVPPAESALPRDYPVSFVGTFDGSRLRELEASGWARTHVWGDGWKRWAGFAEHADHIVPHAIYYLEFADVISRSHISLGLLRAEAEDRHTQRTFEIPACGGFQLAPRNEEIQTYFEEGKEIALFGTPEELKEKVDYYLTHETERKKIARAGHHRCLSGKHTYVDRVSEMLALLSPGLRKTAIA